MGRYIVNGAGETPSVDVAARIPYIADKVKSTTTPSVGDINGWIIEAEGIVEGALAAVKIAVPVTGQASTAIIKSWAMDYVIGRAKESWAANANDDDNESGEKELDRFEKRLEWILANGALADSMLGSAGGDATRRVRGHVLDNKDGKTVADGDFAPEFEVKKQNEQF